MLEAKNVHIQLEFRCSDNFMTEEHYELMAVLKNLVNNAIGPSNPTGRSARSVSKSTFVTGTTSSVSQMTDPEFPPAICRIFLKWDIQRNLTINRKYLRGVGLYGVKNDRGRTV